MIDKILNKENLLHAYKQTQAGKPKHKVPAVRFRQNETANLEEIYLSLQNKTWTPRGYYRFEIQEKKRRIIYAPAYEDKIVHHMLYSKLRDFYEPKFIYDSFSCIRNKGNLKAVKRLQWHMQVCKRNNQNCWLAKIDVSKFFPSIDRDILKKIYRKKITCKDTLDIIDKVIDSSPTQKGLPLGCVTSQLSANVYLNELDHYAKRTLKIKYYLRYADDIFIFCKTKEEAMYFQKECIRFLHSDLNLSCPNEKTYVQNCNKGIHGLGYKLHYTHITIKGISKSRFIKRMKHLVTKTQSEIERSLNSWLSYASVAKHYKFCKLFAKNNNLQFDSKFTARGENALYR